MKEEISCLKCSKLGVTCAAMRKPDAECFKPNKKKESKKK